MSDSTKAVFLSYASQDSGAAKRIADALRAAGVEVWFDQNELVGGDQWDGKIRGQISSCALFIPIISANTQARREGYFRIEWRLAAQRTHAMADGTPYLIPVVIDVTHDTEALVPVEFKSVQWTRLRPGTGEPAPDETLDPGLTKLVMRIGSVLDRSAPGSGENYAANPLAGLTSAVRQERGRRWLLSVGVGAMLLTTAALWQPWREHRVQAGAAEPAVSSGGRQLTLKARALIDDDLMAARESYRLAEELALRGVSLAPDDGEAWATLARISAEVIARNYEASASRKEAARGQMERALKLAPDLVETGLASAAYLETTGEYAAAEAALRPWVARAPMDERVAIAYARLLERTDNARARDFRRSHPAFAKAGARVLAEQAYGLRSPGSFARAAEVAAQAQSLAPSRTGHLTQLLLAMIDYADFDQAKKVIEQIPPQLAQEDLFAALITRHWLRSGNPALALMLLNQIPQDFFEEVRRVEPKGYLTGRALELSGKPVAAEAAWKAALDVLERRMAADPNRLPYVRYRAVLLALTGRAEEAERTLRLLMDLINPDRRIEVLNGNLARVEVLMAANRLAEAVEVVLAERKWEDPDLMSLTSLQHDPWFASVRQDPRVQALLARGEAGRRVQLGRPSQAAGNAKIAEVGDDKSVAVLAFANLSDDKANEYFSDGISEELLNVLAKVPGLKVSARTSAFYFKGKEVPVPEIAKQLGVAYVVEGSVRKAGNKVRITAQLIKADGGFHVWSDTFTRDLRDIFAVQDEIAGLIAQNLQLTLRTNARVRSVNPEAYELMLKGRAYFSRGSPAEYPRSIQLLKDSLSVDPGSAAAWGRLSMGYMMAFAQNVPDWLARDEILRLARQAADRAVELDPEQASGHYARSLIAYLADWDWAGAEASMQRVLELTPSDAESLSLAASLALTAGQTKRARETALRGVGLDPLNFLSIYQLLKTYWQSGDYEKLEEECRRLIAIHPGSPYGHTFLSYSLVLRGRAAEAKMAAERVPSASYRLCGLALANHALGKTSEAETTLEELKKQFGRTSAYQVAENYAFREDRDQAFEWLEAAYRERDSGLTLITNDPFMASLRADARWGAFMRKLNLPAGGTQ